MATGMRESVQRGQDEAVARREPVLRQRKPSEAIADERVGPREIDRKVGPRPFQRPGQRDRERREIRRVFRAVVELDIEIGRVACERENCRGRASST